MKTIRIFCIVLFLFLFSPILTHVFATTELPTVTILNPIRGNELGHDNENLLPGLQAEWQATNNLGLHATWLWQYSALEDKQLVDFAKSHMQQDEPGLFFEIDKNFAEKSGVRYRGRGPWYFSDGLLLVSYDNTEKKKLIDTAFTKFKDTFGQYPKTVGAWWIGADSLDYMQEKYGITGAMKAADQYGIDAYTIWGSPWGIAYVPSKTNEGIPASNFEDSSKVVVMQWAARDPLQAYGNNLDYGTYSTQDYETKGYDISYFTYLLNTYLHNSSDQLLVGLENSNAALFSNTSRYTTVLKTVLQLQKEGKVKILLAKDYAKEFLDKKNILPPTHVLLTKDFASTDQAFWYISSHYQLSIQKRENDLYLVDVRNYADKTPEVFSFLPNSQGNLFQDTPAIIDSATFPQQKIFLGKINESLTLQKNNNQTILASGNTTVGIFTENSAKIMGKYAVSFMFEPSLKQPSAFLIIFSIYLLLTVIVFLATTNKQKRISALLLFVPLLIAFPFLQNNFYIFDKKQLFLSSFLLIPLGTLQTKLFLFQTLPFFLLFLIFIVSLKFKTHWVLYGYVIFLSILFLHFPYFPLDRSTYKIIAISFVSTFLALIFLTTLLGKITHSKKVFLIGLCAVVFLLIAEFPALLISRTREVISPFEVDALQVVSQQKNPVLFIQPNDIPIYKAVRPLLFDNPTLIERLTRNKTIIVKRDSKNNLILPSGNYLIFIPRYLGSTIYPEEVEKYHLQKVFDNMEIAVFKK